ncbi:uncharacterized protein LOC115482948 [Drosophila hydei]|uniref:Uncharacterized protein LOC115482948 n=1 Tax=Drosophila hydei TaxID=7224 RepID=A0A6J2SQ79_DROHY|nr:uncharacterized protein LOC115482948 [Drosophila hydei]
MDAHGAKRAAEPNAYEQLAKKIWRPTVTDAQLGMPNHLDELGSPSQADTELQLDPSPAATSGFLNEVLNALYGDTTGHPENGSFSYHKAAEHYALNGVDYQLQSTTPSFTGEGGGGVPPKAQPPPGFERGAKALYDRKHPAIVGHNARAGASSAYNQMLSGLLQQQHSQCSHGGGDTPPDSKIFFADKLIY